MVDSLVLHYLEIWRPVGYGLIFFGMIFEGDIFLFTAGFLVFQGFLSGCLTFFVVFSGVLIGDSWWYLLGHWINSSPHPFNRWLVRIVKPFDNHLMNWSLHTIFISKFIYGIHHLILIRAGILGLPYKKYISYDLISALAWIFVIGGLGFLSGASFELIRHNLRFVEYALVIGLAVFIILQRLVVRRQLWKKL